MLFFHSCHIQKLDVYDWFTKFSLFVHKIKGRCFILIFDSASLTKRCCTVLRFRSVKAMRLQSVKSAYWSAAQMHQLSLLNELMLRFCFHHGLYSRGKKNDRSSPCSCFKNLKGDTTNLHSFLSPERFYRPCLLMQTEPIKPFIVNIHLKS